MMQSTVLLLLLNDTQDIMGRIPAKLFEYLAAKRPVLAIGNLQGDAAKIIHETGAGLVADFKDKQAIKNAVSTIYKQFKSGELKSDTAGIAHYSRQNITKKYAELLSRITTKQ
ncbi:MAG: hypothetical protein IPO24_13790 [Bacteroidetes bacterium]|nr:hypothetical protein [Bacteroidota bacterium]